MPWQETDPMLERHHFAQDLATGHWTMTELCIRYGISRPTGYKWRDRYLTDGPAGLTEHSRAPRTSPLAVAPDVVELILADSRTHGWGARKILARLQRRDPARAWPARSTIDDILRRHGCVQPRRRRTRWQHPGVVPPVTQAPNDLWTIDFKGQFRTQDGLACYPLTVVDLHSRFLLCCHGLPDVSATGVRTQLLRLFTAHGLPKAIRSDNGSPFASSGIHGLTGLNVWWLQLGIRHQRIQPGAPQQNGAHERMHRTLKARVTHPAAANHRSQQRAFNAFCQTYNYERPHEALHDATPASCWTPSPRPYPATIAPPSYPGHCEVRRISSAGMFCLQGRQYFLSQTLSGEQVALEPLADDLFNIIYYTTLLGRFDARTATISGAPSLKDKC